MASDVIRTERPTVILLPGMDGAARLLTEFAEALQPVADVQLFDLPDDRIADYDALADIVRARLPDIHAYYLLGYSFSGPLAIRLAAEHPSGLAGLVLCCTFARTPRPLLTRIANIVPTRWIPRWFQTALLFGFRAESKTGKAFAAVLGELDAGILKDRIRSASAVDETPKLSGVKVRSLYLQAQGDQLIPASAGRLIADRLPDCRVKVVPGPHALLHVQPNTAAAEVAAFIQGIEI